MHRVRPSFRPGFRRSVALPIVIAVAALAGCQAATPAGSDEGGGPPASAEVVVWHPARAATATTTGSATPRLKPGLRLDPKRRTACPFPS